MTALDQVDWATCLRTLPGEAESGDACLVVPSPEGVLALVVDGLGHGSAAAEAARRAIRSAEGNARRSLEAILMSCHEALIGTRGAVISVAMLDFRRQELSWAGVGNVEGLVLKPGPAAGSSSRIASLVTRAGVVGYQLPEIRPASVPFAQGACLVLATDGIDHRFGAEVVPGSRSQYIANRAVEHHWRGKDDALVLVLQHSTAS